MTSTPSEAAPEDILLSADVPAAEAEDDIVVQNTDNDESIVIPSENTADVTAEVQRAYRDDDSSHVGQADTPAVDVLETDPDADETIPANPSSTYQPFDAKNSHVSVRAPYSTATSIRNREEPIYMPGVSGDEFSQFTEHLDPKAVAGNDEATAWLQASVMGAGAYEEGNVFASAQRREDSDWRQGLDAQPKPIALRQPKVLSDGVGRLSGTRAVMRMNAVMNLGAVLRVPLYHSGFWLTVRAPGEAELLDFDRLLGSEKVRLGRSTSGLVFSNLRVVAASLLVDMILKYVVESSVPYEDPAELKKRIKLSDYEILVWGYLCAIYPNGYPYERPCVGREPKDGLPACTHVEKATLLLSKLIWVDQSRFSEEQRAHMQKMKSSTEDVERYVKSVEERYADRGVIDIEGRMKINLRVPTLEDYETSGRAWVNDIAQSMDQVFKTPGDQKARHDYVMQRAALSALNQYVHYVKSIELGGNFVDDVDSIRTMLTTLTADDAIYHAFFEGISRYVNETVSAIIAIPRYHCEACNRDQGQPSEDSNSKYLRDHPYLIPISAHALFFTITNQRIIRLLSARKTG